MALTVAELEAMDVGQPVVDRDGTEWKKEGHRWLFEGMIRGHSSARLVDLYAPIISRGLRQRPGDQALPTASTGPSMHDLAIQVHGERAQTGLERYGQPLQAMNGRDAVRDTIEELADGLAYALQIREERRLLLAELVELHTYMENDPVALSRLANIIDRYFPEETS